MSKKHAGGIVIATGFRVDDPTPLDDRLVVGTILDLTSSAALPNVYGGIVVAVSESNYDLYKWNGQDRTELSNWSVISGSSASETSLTSSLSLNSETASIALNAITASYIKIAETASFVESSSFTQTTLSSSFALTSSHVLNLDLSTLASAAFDGNRKISAAQIPGLFNVNPYENAYGSFNEDSSSISDFLEAVFYPPKPNLPPLITSPIHTSVAEFTPSESLVHVITAIDQLILGDPETGDVITTFRTQSTYTDDFFRITNPQIGEVTLNTTALSSMNSPGGQHPLGDSHQFYYEVGDERGAFTSGVLYIRIIPDAKPEFTTPSGILNTINEFEAPGLFIATVEGTDAENGVTFRTSSNNTDGFFNIPVESNGNIFLTSQSKKSMNTDPTNDAYPLDIEVVDQFGQATLRTFFIKIKPNTAPIFKKGTSTGNTLTNEYGITLFEAIAGAGPINGGTIFAVNTNSIPLENDNITLETGSLDTSFTNDFNLTINNNEDTTPSVVITQIANSLNTDVTSTYKFILTASDSHYQLITTEGTREDDSSVNYLEVNINVTDNLHPQLDFSTSSFSINENSDNGTLILDANGESELKVTDPDASLGVEEIPFIHSLQLLGAFKTPSTTNLTGSLNGQSLTDPNENPFIKIPDTLEIKRKNNVFLNSDIANLYKYRVNIGSDQTGSGADIGEVHITINNHTPDSTLSNNFLELGTPFIIESAETNDKLKVNSDGFSGADAEISFGSGISHTYIVSSSNDFIKTPEPGAIAVLELKKNISKSAFIRDTTIDLEITASQTDFPTTVQSASFTIKVSPNNAPNLSVDTTTNAIYHTTNGALSGQNTLATINYSNPDTEGDAPNFDTFTFEGDSLSATLDEVNNRYEIKSLHNLDLGRYPFTASLKDTHGFASSSIQSVITIGSSAPSVLSGNNSDTENGNLKFYIIETATEGTKVVKESHGRPGSGTQADLNVTYNDVLETSTDSFTAAVNGNSSVFSIDNDGKISAGSNFNAQGFSVGEIITVFVTNISNIGTSHFNTIVIEVKENIPPDANVTPEPNLESPLSANETLLTIAVTNTQLQLDEGDTILSPNVTVDGINVNVISENSNFIVKNIESITTSTPTLSSYTPILTFNSSQFFVVENAQENDDVVINNNGASIDSNTQADINIDYDVSITPQNYPFSFDLKDSSNKSRNFTGNISISPPKATFVTNGFGITIDGVENIFKVDSQGNISVGSGFASQEYSSGTSLTATITALDSYGNIFSENIIINVTSNHAPTANVIVNDLLISPVNIGETLLTIPAGNINDLEEDIVIKPTVSEIGGSQITVTPDSNISSPYTSITYQFTNDTPIINTAPLIDDYNADISDNNGGQFYITETAVTDQHVVTNTAGVGGNQADVNVSYSLPSAIDYSYNIILQDDSGLSNNLTGVITVNHSESVATNFEISSTTINGISTPNSIIKISSTGTIAAGNQFANENLDAGDVINSVVTITNSYGHTHTHNIAINVIGNLPPFFTLSPAENLQVPVAENVTLITISNIGDPEGDTIQGVEVTITAPGGASVPLNTPIISGYNDIILTTDNGLTLPGTYSFSVALVDINGNQSEAQTGTFTVSQEAPTVRVYKANIDGNNNEVLSNISIGFNDGSLTGGSPSIVPDSVLNHFKTETFTTSTSGINVSAGPAGQNKTLKFVASLNLNTISDISSNFGDNNGISQFGFINLNGERLIIVFPADPTSTVEDAPDTMLDSLVGTISDETNRYFLFNVSSGFDGGTAFASNIVSFTRDVDGLIYKVIFTESPKTGNYKFYLLPDENTTNLPTT